MNKQKMTLREKINFITKYTAFTDEELLDLPIETFDKIFTNVQEMRKAIMAVEADVILYKKK